MLTDEREMTIDETMVAENLACNLLVLSYTASHSLCVIFGQTFLMIRLRFLILLFPLFVNHSSAQSFIYQKYWIQFTDKNNNPYSLSNPQAFLSPRAIERRQRENISYDERDLPVTPAYVDSIASTGVFLYYRSKWLNSVTAFITDTTVLVKIRKFSFVKKVSPVYATSFQVVGPALRSDQNPADQNPAFREEYDTLKYGQGYNQINMLQGKSLHDKGYTGQGIVIAMLDAGYNNTDKLSVFDSLRAGNRILGTFDFVKPHNNVYGEHTHGSECL
jgi:serine protease AprX